jgi:hypothetical protein
VETLRNTLLQVLALLQDGEGQPIDIQMKSRMDGTYACSYTPLKAIKHTIAVVWGGVNIPHSPYRVSCEAHADHMRNPGYVLSLHFVYRWSRQTYRKNPFWTRLEKKLVLKDKILYRLTKWPFLLFGWTQGRNIFDRMYFLCS